MKFLVVALCLFAVGMAAPSPQRFPGARHLPALQHEEIHDAFGQYALRYLTAEGTMVSERGHLVPSASGYVMVRDGETSFIGDDGIPYVTRYSAGLDGAHFEGAHLPKAPLPLF